MTALGTVLLQAFCCLGLGAVVLRLLGILQNLSSIERWTWSFAVGFGVLGWILFYFGIAGWFQATPLILLLCAGATGLLFLMTGFQSIFNNLNSGSIDSISFLIFTAFIAVAVLDIFEGLSPPTDGDTLAYHFVHPKNFIEAGKLLFVPRGGDGAIPMIVHMTYITPLKLGGERALTLWVMLSGWAATALLYSIARRFMDSRWSLILALVFITTPAVIYGAGSGQVEVKIVMFVMIAATSITLALKTGLMRYAVLAGIAAGFFMGAKFLGLLFATACGLVIIAQRQGLKQGVIFSAAALIAGGQWYLWNYAHTGDPVFPVLFGFLKNFQYFYWDQDHAEAFNLIWVNEKSVPVNFFWFIAYPFIATFFGHAAMEAGRTGVGPYVALLLPFIFAAVWASRQRILKSTLLPLAAIFFIYYALWFFTGSSQRIRHLLPLYPLLLICVTAAALGWTGRSKYMLPLTSAVLLTLSLQLAGQFIFNINYAKHIFSGETKQAFLRKAVLNFTAVPWINKNLNTGDLLYTQERQLTYLFKIPVYYGHWALDAKIDTRPQATNAAKFLSELTSQKVTHLLSVGSIAGNKGSKKNTTGVRMWRALYKKGCLKLMKSFTGTSYGSRTIKLSKPIKTELHVFKIHYSKCQL